MYLCGRMIWKLRNGDSAGTVVSFPVLDRILIVSTESVIMQACLPYIIVINLLQFEGKNTTGSKAYKFRCQLDKFDVNVNAFTKKFMGHMSTYHQFCDTLVNATSVPDW